MILKYLTLHNFGVYAGTNTVDFSRATQEKPVVLVGGLNGRGKTTLLEAILLVLYGKFSHAVNATRLSYPDYLKKFIHRGTHESYIELCLRIHPDQPELTVRRSWSDFEEPVEDRFTVHCDDQPDPHMAKDWYNYMDSVLPSGISNLFFFDGEKITELADDTTDTGLKDSIRALLGIDTIDRLIADLERIVDRQSEAVHNKESGKKLDGLKGELAETLRLLEATQFEFGNCVDELAANAEAINDSRDQLLMSGGKQKKNRDKEKQQRMLDEITQEIQDTMAGSFPLAMVLPLLRDLTGDIGDAIATHNAQIGEEQVRLFQNSLVAHLRSSGLDADSLNLVLDYIEDQSAGHADHGSGAFFTSQSTLERIHQLVGQDLAAAARRLPELLAERDRLQAQMTNNELYFNKMKDKAGNEELVALYDALTERKYELLGRKKQYGEMIAQLEVAERDLKRQIRELQQSMLEQEHQNLKEARTVEYANNSIKVMEEYKARLQASKVQGLEKAINSCFGKLIGKENLVHRISIDPVSLDLFLLNERDKAFTKTTLSAGERQMLAIATLWGLSSCMEDKLPVFIDTPLARLDSTHRERFINEYLPYAGDQVVVLSTDEEIYGPYHDMLDPFVSSSYLLEFDRTTSSTSIVDGYLRRA